MKMNDNYSEALKLYKENKLNEAKVVLENDINISENITSIYLHYHCIKTANLIKLWRCMRKY